MLAFMPPPISFGDTQCFWRADGMWEFIGGHPNFRRGTPTTLADAPLRNDWQRGPQDARPPPEGR